MEYAELFKAYVAQVDATIKRSGLAHSTLKNIRETGDEVEHEVRGLLTRSLPARFKVTHGYIASLLPNTSSPTISGQHDVIVVDTLVPHRILPTDFASGLEVVPLESVVAIAEVKRTLNRESLFSSKQSALSQISKTMQDLKVRKDRPTDYFPGGVICPSGVIGASADGRPIELSIKNGYRSNPLLAVIGLRHDDSLPREIIDDVENYDLGDDQTASTMGLDMVASLGGLICATSRHDAPEHEFAYFNDRSTVDQVGYRVATGQSVGNSASAIVAAALGFVVGYVTSTTGRQPANPMMYYSI